MSVNQIELMTTEELLDVVTARQKSRKCLYFISYEDDEDHDHVFFDTNMTEEDFGLMVDMYKQWKGIEDETEDSDY